MLRLEVFGCGGGREVGYVLLVLKIPYFALPIVKTTAEELRIFGEGKGIDCLATGDILG